MQAVVDRSRQMLASLKFTCPSSGSWDTAWSTAGTTAVAESCVLLACCLGQLLTSSSSLQKGPSSEPAHSSPVMPRLCGWPWHGGSQCASGLRCAPSQQQHGPTIKLSSHSSHPDRGQGIRDC